MFRTCLIVASVFYIVVLPAAFLWLFAPPPSRPSSTPGPGPQHDSAPPPATAPAAPPPTAPLSAAAAAAAVATAEAARAGGGRMTARRGGGAGARRGLLRVLSLGRGEAALTCPITCLRFQDPVRGPSFLGMAARETKRHRIMIARLRRPGAER